VSRPGEQVEAWQILLAVAAKFWRVLAGITPTGFLPGRASVYNGTRKLR
jgi:hypothetical protein